MSAEGLSSQHSLLRQLWTLAARGNCWGSQPGLGAALLPLPCLGNRRRYLRPRHSWDQPHKHRGKQTTPRRKAYAQAYGVTHWSEVGLGTPTTLLGSAEGLT